MFKFVQVWVDSDLLLFQYYEDWCDCVYDEFDCCYLYGLLEQCNLKMVECFVVLYVGGKCVFVVVGVLYMIGFIGLFVLLKKMGFMVECFIFVEFC